MEKLAQLVVFTLDQQRYALHFSAVERVVRAVEITPLPKAPDIVIGVINLYGSIIPVLNIRKRFRLPEKELGLNDHFLIARMSVGTIAIVVDAVSGVLEASEELSLPEAILSEAEYVEGIVKLEDGMVLIHDLEKFLSLKEKKTMEMLDFRRKI